MGLSVLGGRVGASLNVGSARTLTSAPRYFRSFLAQMLKEIERRFLRSTQILACKVWGTFALLSLYRERPTEKPWPWHTPVIAPSTSRIAVDCTGATF